MNQNTIVKQKANVSVDSALWAPLLLTIKPTVRSMLGDAVLFLLSLLILAVAFAGLQALERLGYPHQNIVLLEKLHFWGYFAVLAVLLIDLLIKIAAHAWGRK